MPLELPCHTVAGTPTEMGHALGERLKPLIAAFVDQRLRAARVYLREKGVRDSDALVSLGKRCLHALASWDPDGHSEHCALAEAAGIDAAQLYTAANMTDIRDILALPAPADAEGCTAVLIPPTHVRGKHLLAAQTWDLNPGDLEFVVAIQRKPTHGPATWSITCAGCPTLIGMNQHGLAVGTTNIKVRGSRVGIPYLGILHRAIRCATLGEAASVIEHAHRAAAHTYWVADRHAAAEWECTALSAVRRDLHDVPLVRTNHCLHSAHQTDEGEAPSASSLARLRRMSALSAAHAIDIETLKAMFADRNDGVESINRLPEDHQGTTTNACIVAVPASRMLYACRGSADRGTWVQLGFG